MIQPIQVNLPKSSGIAFWLFGPQRANETTHHQYHRVYSIINVCEHKLEVDTDGERVDLPQQRLPPLKAQRAYSIINSCVFPCEHNLEEDGDGEGIHPLNDH